MGDIVKFPGENKRLDLSNIPLDHGSVVEQDQMLKLSYFSDVAEAMLDDTLRSMSMLKLEEGRFPTNPIEQKDIILMKESIVAGMCRIVGIEHPLHRLMDDNLEVTSVTDGEEEVTMGYRFKDVEVKN